MPEACFDVGARARKIQSIVLKRLHTGATQDSIAVAMGIDASTVSRLLSVHLPNFAGLLAHAGLKVVPVSARCFKPEEVDALVLLAKRHMASVTSSQQLEWDED